MGGRYKLKCWVTESFYEHILEENYTPAESLNRCLDEYARQLSGGGPEALTVYSTLLYRLLRCAPEGLQNCRREIGEMNRLWASEARGAFSGDALEDLEEEVKLINRHSG